MLDCATRRLPAYGTKHSLTSNGSGAWRVQVRAMKSEDTTMAWTTPTLVEICVGLEINGYLPAEF
ncbi:pyrroloquinoline quinone biosynthesis protein PqqA [Rhodoplanes sp. Z2-YC6860]|nr:pyrroloquinoline quinone biosynthesis protein PqqA [Rhodoplanes sp. Z2-YC6860]